jgi:hypothetical protein
VKEFHAFPASFREVSPGTSVPILNRIESFRNFIEGYIDNLAASREEFPDDELPRLQAEVTALLVVLRELGRHVPETSRATKH